MYRTINVIQRDAAIRRNRVSLVELLGQRSGGSPIAGVDSRSQQEQRTKGPKNGSPHGGGFGLAMHGFSPRCVLDETEGNW